MIYLFFVAAVLLLLLVLAADHVRARFEHTPRSRFILQVEAGASLVVAVALVAYLFQPQSTLWLVVGGVGLGLPLFVVMAFATVELWRRRKQGKFDRQLRELANEISAVREEVQRLNWKERDLAQRRSRLEGKHRERLEEQAEVRHRLAQWERGGGLTRLRTIKVRAWQEEFKQLTRDKLDAKEAELQERLESADSEEREQLRAQLYVLELVDDAGTETASTSPASSVETDLGELRRRRRAFEQELAALEQDLAEWRQRKRRFLGDKIRLD